MVSRDTVVGAAFIALAFAAVYAVLRVPGAPDWAPTAVLLVVGVLVPVSVNGYLDARSGSEAE